MLLSINKNRILFFLLAILSIAALLIIFKPAPSLASSAESFSYFAADKYSGDCKANLRPENCGITAYIQTFIRILSSVAGLVIVIMIAFGGAQYTLSRDNPQETAAAKSKIFNALLALAAYLFMFAFLQWVVPGGVI